MRAVQYFKQSNVKINLAKPIANTNIRSIVATRLNEDQNGADQDGDGMNDADFQVFESETDTLE